MLKSLNQIFFSVSIAGNFINPYNTGIYFELLNIYFSMILS